MTFTKRLILSLISGAICTIAGIYINDYYYKKMNKLLFCIRIYDGNWTDEYGFGMKVMHHISSDGRESLVGRADEPSLLISYILCCVICFFILTGINKLIKRKYA